MPKIFSSSLPSQSISHSLETPLGLSTDRPRGLPPQGDKFAAASALTSLHRWSPQLEEDNADMNVDNKDDGSVDNDGNKKDKEEDEIPLTFPQRLMDILSNDEHSDVITWLPHGKAFIVYKKKKFTSDVLPRYFKQSKYTSFTRKLNRWGFTRVTRGPETGAYFHILFRRDNMELCSKMCCKSLKSPIPNRVVPAVEICVPDLQCEMKEGASYVPPPAFPPDASRALELAKNVHQNTLLVQQLIEKVSLQSQVNIISHQQPSLQTARQTLLSHQQQPFLPQPQQVTSSFYPAMNPNSNLSMSVVQAALTALNRSNNPSGTPQHPSPQTQALLGLAKQIPSPQNFSLSSNKSVPRVQRRASAA